MKRIGSRLEVINGLAMKTSGGLKVNDLIINKRGKVVSKKLHEKAIKQYGGTVNINKYKSITELHNIPNNLRTYKNNMIGKTAKLNLMTKDNFNIEPEYKYEKLIFQLLFRLNPPIKNIVKHIEFIDDKKTIYMEYCGKDLMYYIIKNKGPTTYIDILKFMKTLTKIILDLHGNGLILYDIKPENITLMHDNDYENNVRLIDVGGINQSTISPSLLPIEIYARFKFESIPNDANDYIIYNSTTIHDTIMKDKLFMGNNRKFVYSALASTLFTILFGLRIFHEEYLKSPHWAHFYKQYNESKNLFQSFINIFSHKKNKNSINDHFKPRNMIVGDPPNSDFEKLCELIDRYYLAKNDEDLTDIYNYLTTTIDEITNRLTIRNPIIQTYTRM